MSNQLTLVAADRRLSKTLHRIYTTIRVFHYDSRPVSRSMCPGTNCLRHMSVGALAAEATRAWADGAESTMLPLISAELRTRGFTESSDLLHQPPETSEPVVDVDTLFTAQTSIDTKLSMLVGAVNDFAEHVDTFDRRALSPREVIDDLIEMNAPTPAVDAFVQAVGTSEASPSDVIAAEMESGNHSASHQSAATQTSTPQRENEITL